MHLIVLLARANARDREQVAVTGELVERVLPLVTPVQCGTQPPEEIKKVKARLKEAMRHHGKWQDEQKIGDQNDR
jgi:hypothetical protein